MLCVKAVAGRCGAGPACAAGGRGVGGGIELIYIYIYVIHKHTHNIYIYTLPKTNMVPRRTVFLYKPIVFTVHMGFQRSIRVN